MAFSRPDWPQKVNASLSIVSEDVSCVICHFFLCGERVIAAGLILGCRRRLPGTRAPRSFSQCRPSPDECALGPAHFWSLNPICLHADESQCVTKCLGWTERATWKRIVRHLLPSREAPSQQAHKKIHVRLLQQAIRPPSLNISTSPYDSAGLRAPLGSVAVHWCRLL